MKPKEIYKSQAWKYFSRWTLLKFADSNGLVRCSTCGKVMVISDQGCHCGHLIKVTDSAACIFEECNVAPQCMRCNRYQGGRPDVMKDFLTAKYGVIAIERLYVKKRNVCKLNSVILEILKEEYKAKYEGLARAKGHFWK